MTGVSAQGQVDFAVIVPAPPSAGPGGCAGAPRSRWRRPRCRCALADQDPAAQRRHQRRLRAGGRRRRQAASRAGRERGQEVEKPGGRRDVLGDRDGDRPAGRLDLPARDRPADPGEKTRLLRQHERRDADSARCSSHMATSFPEGGRVLFGEAGAGREPRPCCAPEPAPTAPSRGAAARRRRISPAADRAGPCLLPCARSRPDPPPSSPHGSEGRGTVISEGAEAGRLPDTARGTPDHRTASRVRQVSWLAGHRRRISLPGPAASDVGRCGPSLLTVAGQLRYRTGFPLSPAPPGGTRNLDAAVVLRAPPESQSSRSRQPPSHPTVANTAPPIKPIPDRKPCSVRMIARSPQHRRSLPPNPSLPRLRDSGCIVASIAASQDARKSEAKGQLVSGGLRAGTLSVHLKRLMHLSGVDAALSCVPVWSGALPVRRRFSFMRSAGG